MKLESPDTVTTKIKDIRSKMRVEKTDKIQDGKKRAKAGSTPAAVGTESGGQEVTEDGRAGGEGPKVRFWDVPEEFEVDYTKGEDLKDVIQGPDYAWHRDVHRELPPHHGRDGTSAPQEAKHLVQKAQELGKSPALQALEGATDDLYAWAAARVAREPGVELSSLLQEMATYGMGELAREAAELLEQREGTKAGSARLVVRDTLWAEGQPGQGSVELDGTTWRLWDYQEDVMMTEDLAALLHLPEVSIERRQCVTITIAAMVEWKEKSRRPSVEQVQTRAQSLRLEQTRLAVDAANTIGEAEEMVAAPHYSSPREGLSLVGGLPFGGPCGLPIGGFQGGLPRGLGRGVHHWVQLDRWGLDDLRTDLEGPHGPSGTAGRLRPGALPGQRGPPNHACDGVHVLLACSS